MGIGNRRYSMMETPFTQDGCPITLNDDDDKDDDANFGPPSVLSSSGLQV